MMEFEDIERILELVRQHDLAEFEVEQDGLKLRVRKAAAADVPTSAASCRLPPRPRRTPPAPRPVARRRCPRPRRRTPTPSSSRS